MFKRKFAFLLFFILISLMLSGCGGPKSQYMDRPAEDGNFYYTNKDFGFTVVLPPEFLYYQTQRRSVGEFTDIEFFVPTSDTDYLQEVPDYAKPIVIRVMDNEEWKKQENIYNDNLYEKIGEQDGMAYVARFWQTPPKDWLDKWSMSMKEDIVDRFVLK